MSEQIGTKKKTISGTKTKRITSGPVRCHKAISERTLHNKVKSMAQTQLAAIGIYLEGQNEPTSIEPTLLRLPSDEADRLSLLKQTFIELTAAAPGLDEEDQVVEVETDDLTVSTDSSYGDYVVTDGQGLHLIVKIVTNSQIDLIIS